MGVRSKWGKLFLDFRWRGRRCREFTGLDDTNENRRRADAFLKVIQGQIALGYDPDLNDGVVLNIAPFHEITPWKVAKQYWDELCEGKYEWSTMSKRLREKGLVAGA